MHNPPRPASGLRRFPFQVALLLLVTAALRAQTVPIGYHPNSGDAFNFTTDREYYLTLIVEY